LWNSLIAGRVPGLAVFHAGRGEQIPRGLLIQMFEPLREVVSEEEPYVNGGRVFGVTVVQKPQDSVESEESTIVKESVSTNG
jgi:hypothetical protein